MALQKIIKVEGNAYVSTPGGNISMGTQKTSFVAYCKIVSIQGTKQSGKVIVESTGDTFKSVSEYEVPFTVENDSPNFVKQAYLHLKTLPDFAEASDC